MSDPGRWVRTGVTRRGLDAAASVSHRSTGLFIYKLLLRVNCGERRKLYGGVQRQGELAKGKLSDVESHAYRPTLVSGKGKRCFTLMVANA